MKYCISNHHYGIITNCCFIILKVYITNLLKPDNFFKILNQICNVCIFSYRQHICYILLENSKNNDLPFTKKKKMGKFNKDIRNCDQALDQSTDPSEKNRESEP